MSHKIWEATSTPYVWTQEANEPGPSVMILGGVHGDETAGAQVIAELRSTLKVECGRVTLAVGNPVAVAAGVRRVETNLNRNFRPLDPDQTLDQLTYEEQRAQALLPYMDASAAALDLHEHSYPSGPPFIITERNGFETARKIGAPIISFGWSRTEPGGTDGYMFEQGKEGICYELGYKHDAQANVDRGIAVVQRFLGAHGLIEAQLEPLASSPKFIETDKAFIRESEDFAWGRTFDLFEELVPGELIAHHGGVAVHAGEHQVIIFPEANPPLGTEAFTVGHVRTVDL